MKIAFAKENNKVAAHFGHCNDFRIVEVIDNKVIHTEDVHDDVNTHHSRANYLKSLGVDVLVVSGLGEHAHQSLINESIKVLDGKHLSLSEALALFIMGKLTEEIKGHAHNHEHSHGHHH
jgi:predicted Fe-Mo cluster-binding NifX family protein